MIRVGLVLLWLLVLVIPACSSSPRFSGEIAKVDVDDEAEAPPVGTFSRIDAIEMDRVIAKYMGVPYRSGGTGKLGIDCSGLTYVVFRDYDGTRLPISVNSLFRLEDRVEYNELTYGDLVFFKINKRKVSHVGIYLGAGRFLHASTTRGVVIDDLADQYWAERYCGARRVK
ncbi:MAG: C40 family peptidase [bacterium]